jgi:transposase
MGEEEVDMRTRAIGVDPDSTGGVCSLVDSQRSQVSLREYSISQEGLQLFVRWAKQPDTVVALEGLNGHSAPFEQALRGAGVVFYSFTASEVNKFRSTVLGQNKTNARDAQAVARYALALEAQNRLELSRRVWFPDEGLQALTRLYRQKRGEATREMNRLWKTLRTASGDLYLAFRAESSFSDSALKQVGILRLLSCRPDAGSWHVLSLEELADLMGAPRPSRLQLLRRLLPRLSALGPLSAAMCTLIQTSAQILMALHTALLHIENQIQLLTAENPAVRCLCTHHGMGVLTAALIVAEIIDIRRFPTNNHLASYAGLARHECKTGRSATELATAAFNHRLKYALYSAARNMTVNDPSSHLSAYYRHLVNGGMPITEAHKRVSRALVRTIYRELKALSETQSEDTAQQKGQKEGDVATGSGQQAQSAPSNTPPSSAHYTPGKKHPAGIKSPAGRRAQSTPRASRRPAKGG